MRYIEEFHSDYTEGQALHAGVVEVAVGEEAKVEFTSMQEWGRNVYSFATRYAQVEKGGLMHFVSRRAIRSLMTTTKRHMKGQEQHGEEGKI